ncbi:MAG: hypothetical protein E7I57_02680 [Anaerococcus vaginalis]|nr:MULTISPECIES: hypothetical protein [Anaerococcus]MDU4378334.1 hypothetical protein [Anaerococcus vaginalis]MDU5372841.1 hypothetical protein [Anaerococcus vaginalis]MDU7141927.1 hypothetical protein [Anaerococcus vaginalis]
MSLSERGGIFVLQLVGDTLYDLMTDGEEKMYVSDKFNQVTKLFLNMQYQIFKGKKYILKNRDGLICSRYDEADFAEEI